MMATVAFSTASASDSTAGAALPDAWKQLKVSDFLQQVNWSNRPELTPAEDLSPGMSVAVAVEDLHLQLSVSQFFAAIPWTGKEANVQLPALIDPASQAELLPLELPDVDEFADGAGDAGENLTLDDFFDTFSDF